MSSDKAFLSGVRSFFARLVGLVHTGDRWVGGRQGLWKKSEEQLSRCCERLNRSRN